MEDTFEQWWASHAAGQAYKAFETPTPLMVKIKDLARAAFEAGRIEGEESSRNEQIPCICSGDNRYYR